MSRLNINNNRQTDELFLLKGISSYEFILIRTFKILYRFTSLFRDTKERDKS